jgi:hypothetical protein
VPIDRGLQQDFSAAKKVQNPAVHTRNIDGEETALSFRAPAKLTSRCDRAENY